MLLVVLLLLIALIAARRWVTLFDDSVTLPNGLVLKTQFDFSTYGRDDLFSADVRRLLARDIEFTCFNDRYMEVTSYERGQRGLYDALAERWITGSQAHRDSGLTGGRGCNGYYTGMVGAGMLYDGEEAPFLPSCAWRTLDREGLADRSRFERPCDDRAGLAPGLP